MKHSERGPAREGEAGIVHASERPAVTTIMPERQRLAPQIQGTGSIADWRDLLVRRGYFETVEVVNGELGPVHLLGSPAPRVMLGSRNGSTFVWICNPVWGHGDCSREFLKTPSAAAGRYALQLAAELRKAALLEGERRDMVKDARLAELMSRREGGCK